MTNTDSSNATKTILVLARNAPAEAMRVAAGLTIFGHDLKLVFMHQQLSAEEADSESAELLELVEIVPQTTVATMQEHFELLNQHALAELILGADIVINL